VLVVGTLVSFLFELPVETIGSRFNGIPQELPDFGLPALSIHDLGKLISPAITIALLGAIESLLSARVADSQIDDRHDPNQELIAQGCQHRRPAVRRLRRHRRHRPHDDQRQDRRPHAGCRHHPRHRAARHRPARRAARRLRAARHPVGHRHGGRHQHGRMARVRRTARYSYNYRIILLSTFLVTVLFDLTIAVELGMVLASLFFIYRMSELTKIERLPMDEEAHDPRFLYPDGTMRVATWQMFGSLFFGAVNKLEELLDPREGHPEIVILDMTRLIQLDTTGLEGLENLRDKLQKRGCTLLVCGLNSQPGSLLYRSGFIDHLGDDNVCPDLSSALQRAYILLPNLMGGFEEDY
jgi:SulP family sulfate permease